MTQQHVNPVEPFLAHARVLHGTTYINSVLLILRIQQDTAAIALNLPM